MKVRFMSNSINFRIDEDGSIVFAKMFRNSFFNHFGIAVGAGAYPDESFNVPTYLKQK